jgi:hypothetical protein
MKKICFCLIIIITIGSAEPTAKTGIYLCDIANESIRDSVAVHFDLAVSYDFKRNINIPLLRDPEEYGTLWRRGMPPKLLMYKGCMTLFDSTSTQYGYPYSNENTKGGGHTVGGFYHFDSLFWGLGYTADTCFYMASESTYQFGHYDSASNRVKAGGESNWFFRWAMDYENFYWQNYFACSSKVQCL